MTPRKAGSEEPPAPPPCEICEMYRMEDSRWILESHINGLHAEIAELRRRIGTLVQPHDLTEKQKEDRRQFYKEIGV